MTIGAGDNLSVCISQVTDNDTVAYAVTELAKYLGYVTCREVAMGQSGIRVGILSDLPELTAPDVENPVLDDAIEIDIRNGEGYIAGINPRSVLLAAYRYLYELGCRWVRPGSDGEYIPTVDNLPDVRVRETASYRHRGICIEGSVSYEHIRDTIEWMPKLGFNAFFTQFRESYTFFDRWYSHESNPLGEGEQFTVDKSREFIADLVDEIKKRGILYQAVGHGWTCEPFGITCLGWEKGDQSPPDEARPYLAMLNGEREYWRGGPIDTNLCYGNPAVRRIITEDIANYSEKHPEIDMLHFWLADGWNNHCECELCRDTRPSDFFVSMLNDVDRLLSERGLPTKIVFLIYVDLLWPPVKGRILNQDRFILMFAPITRTYSSTFSASGVLPQISGYERNKLSMPTSVDMNLAFLRSWQQIFSGDSFDFDYHMMWEHYNDPGYCQIAEIMSRDLKGLKDIGLDGYISCQTQRSYLPTGLPMVVMGKTLWDRSLDFESIADDYFKCAFGPDGGLCRAYLEKLGEAFDPVYMRGEKPAVTLEAVERLRKVAGLISEFAPLIARNSHTSNHCWSRSWTYLKHHAQICALLADTLKARAEGDQTLAESRRDILVDLMWRLEPEIHPVMDAWVFVQHWLPTKFPSPETESWIIS